MNIMRNLITRNKPSYLDQGLQCCHVIECSREIIQHICMRIDIGNGRDELAGAKQKRIHIANK
jgi:hypothetical protein